MPLPEKGVLSLELLRCCRQVYAETALLPYSLNPFTFYGYDHINSDDKQVRAH